MPQQHDKLTDYNNNHLIHTFQIQQDPVARVPMCCGTAVIAEHQPSFIPHTEQPFGSALNKTQHGKVTARSQAGASSAWHQGRKTSSVYTHTPCYSIAQSSRNMPYITTSYTALLLQAQQQAHTRWLGPSYFQSLHDLDFEIC